MMKIAIVVAYFGRFPAYFQTFLESCRWNGSFDWIIFTDDLTPYAYPDNVHRVRMDFQQCRNLIQQHFDFSISLETPQKLCDYKCAYGYVFEDFLKGYDWWGHCDLDQIFGDLAAFVTPERLRTLDKMYSLGHLTLYRNTPRNNRIFMESVRGESRYRKVFTTGRGMGFDEWLPGNVNEIFLDQKVPAIYQNEGADIDPYHTSFVLVSYQVEQRRYEHSPVRNSIFLWDKGKLYRLYSENGSLQQQEFPYIHLQKRRMKDCRSSLTEDRFYIVPNRFVDGTADPAALLKQSQIWTIVNPQYFKVKFQSLKYRIRSGDWIRQNVFS